MSAALLEVDRLSVTFRTPRGPVDAVRELSFSLRAGEVLGLVGESGSGKTQAALATLGLLANNGSASGSIRFEGRELLGTREADLRALRGDRIAVVFQDPMTALNPYLDIGTQMSIALRAHRRLPRAAALRACEDMLESVQITEPRRRMRMHPHELSGGMRQRVMVATALLCRPALLIADEPTTALDVTVQAEILRLLAELRREFGTAILFITHDLGVVAGTCDRMLVMEKGELRENGTVDEVFAEPRHPYTRRLLAAVPRLDRPVAGALPLPGAESTGGSPAGVHADGRTGGGPDADPHANVDRDARTPLLEIDALEVRYAMPAEGWFRPARHLQAVAGVDLELRRGETLGIVGESGSGKSTLVRALLRLVPASAGRIVLLGRSLRELEGEALRRERRHLQLVFQDPLAALDPRMTIRESVAEPLRELEPGLDRRTLAARVLEALENVGLDAGALDRYPHQFSGGQCQRIGIARALVLNPALLVCDEAVSALDVTIQAQIVALLREAQAARGLAMLFIAHDLAVVRELSHRVLVMYLGRVVETADAEALYREPRHPYTRALLAAVPIPDPALERARMRPALTGEIPSPLSPPSGCVFRTRCVYAIERCAAETPVLRSVGASRVACHRAEEVGQVLG